MFQADETHACLVVSVSTFRPSINQNPTPERYGLSNPVFNFSADIFDQHPRPDTFHTQREK
ncbi:MAG: hypothetical protein ACK50M_07690, partial [Cyclobacteriaceae bacterium]